MTTVSIIMGIFNCESTLSESIESIIKQTYTDWELIMCDDGSNDTTYSVAQRYSEKYPEKIFLCKNDKNMGLNFTLNKCIKMSKGVYIARQDADDISKPSRLEKQVEFLNHHTEYTLVGSNMSFFNENGIWGVTSYPTKPTVQDLIKKSPFAHPTVLMRKKELITVGCYDVQKKYLRVEDYLLWTKFFNMNFRGYNLSEELYLYREDSSALSRRTFENRVNETRIKMKIIKDFSLGISSYKYLFIPLATYFFPKFLYNSYRGKKYNLEGRKNE